MTNVGPGPFGLLLRPAGTFSSLIKRHDDINVILMYITVSRSQNDPGHSGVPGIAALAMKG